MTNAQKVRLYPDKTQQQIISSKIGGARYVVYNHELAVRKFAYSKIGVKVGNFALINHIDKLKKSEKNSLIKENDSQSIVNMDKANHNFFKGAGYAKLKSRHHSRQRYQCTQRVKIEANKVFLPKVGWVKCKGFSKEFVGKIKTVTVSYEDYQYHASILIDIEDVEVTNNQNYKTVGIDVGVSSVVADSNVKSSWN